MSAEEAVAIAREFARRRFPTDFSAMDLSSPRIHRSMLYERDTWSVQFDYLPEASVDVYPAWVTILVDCETMQPWMTDKQREWRTWLKKYLRRKTG
jgi:hypothetical protein